MPVTPKTNKNKQVRGVRSLFGFLLQGHGSTFDSLLPCDLPMLEGQKLRSGQILELMQGRVGHIPTLRKDKLRQQQQQQQQQQQVQGPGRG
jgi:hypothetical protein